MNTEYEKWKRIGFSSKEEYENMIWNILTNQGKQGNQIELSLEQRLAEKERLEDLINYYLDKLRVVCEVDKVGVRKKIIELQDELDSIYFNSDELDEEDEEYSISDDERSDE